MPDAALSDEIAYIREVIDHAAPKYVTPAKKKLAELCAERDHRDWLKFDANYPIPKIDAQPASLADGSRVHGAGEGVCSVGNSITRIA